MVKSKFEKVDVHVNTVYFLGYALAGRHLPEISIAQETDVLLSHVTSGFILIVHFKIGS
jgi:hypothetical protein